jgi:hypothetical protein
MAKDETRRIAPSVLEDDSNALTAIKAMTDYAPANSEYSVDNLNNKQSIMNEAHRAELLAKNAYMAARDASNYAQWNFHKSILGAKSQVIAQYGDDSNEVQSLGLKKKSERKRPGGRKPKAK